MQQSNAIDCGAFVHPYPVEVKFDTYKMRMHLLYCLVEHELSQFSRVIEIIENISTKAFPLPYLVTAESLGQHLILD